MELVIVSLTPVAVVLLEENDSYVNYYHCLDKEENVMNMITRRISSDEISVVRNFASGPYRYELVNVDQRRFISPSNVRRPLDQPAEADGPSTKPTPPVTILPADSVSIRETTFTIPFSNDQVIFDS